MDRRGFGLLAAAALATGAGVAVWRRPPDAARGGAEDGGRDDLDRIRATGRLSMAMTGQYPPFNFVDARNRVVGFDPDIGAAIARRLGVAPQIVTTAWDGIIAGLLAGRYDSIIGSMTITPERQQVLDFVGPYYRTGRAVFVPQNAPARGLEDLANARVGAILGEIHETWARRQPGWQVHTYKGLPELMMEVRAGRLDAIVCDSIPVRVAMRETGATLRALPAPEIEGGDVGIGIAIRKGNPALREAMQHALDQMIADGTYDRIAMSWIGSTDIR